MALPTLTPEQRTFALERAKEVRAARKQLLDDVRAGNVTIAQVLERAKDDPIAAKTKVKAVIGALPGYGQARVTKVMAATGVLEDRRVGGLGARQRDALLEAL